MKKMIWILAAVLMASALSAGCTGAGDSVSADQESGAVKTNDLSKDAVEAYASEMVDNMLAGLGKNDYATFSRDFSDTMKAAINEAAFHTMADTFASTIGTYQSKTFYQAANTDKNGVTYTVVIYNARFTDEDADVIITVSFSGEDGGRKIEGLYFNSPKLRGE